MSEVWSGPLLSPEERNRLERAIGKTILLCGASMSNLEVLEPSVTQTVALDADRNPVPQKKLLYATDELDLSIFVATVWERDGLSGWNTYPDYIDYYASPPTLRRALMRQGTIYTVPRSAFERSPNYRAQYISETSVSKIESYPVTVYDMRQHIIQATHVLWLRDRPPIPPSQGNDFRDIQTLPLLPQPPPPPGHSGWWTYYEPFYRAHSEGR